MKIDLQNKIFEEIGFFADKFEVTLFAVGGFVRDILIQKECKDIDLLVIGNGIDFANKIANAFSINDAVVYEKYGTAMIQIGEYKIEFVGARKESYSPESRNPDVKPGSLFDDLSRRDFTINALAISLNKSTFYDLIDMYNGVEDLNNKILRTPLEPERTFSDDPLRMIRAIRFAATLNFEIEPITLAGIKKSAERIKIIAQERITEEFLKIMNSERPSVGLNLLRETTLLKYILPEIDELAIPNSLKDGDEEYHHKNVFHHTLKVVDNIAKVSNNVWLRIAGLFHDVAKPKTRHFSKGLGWSFHGHEEIGAKMIPNVFRKFKLPFDKIEYIQKLIRLHLRPIALVDQEVTDSAIRRLIFEAGNEIDDLMMLCRADITSKNLEKVEQFKKNYEYVERRVKEVEEKDKIRNFQPPIDGNEIMEMFKLKPGPMVGKIKDSLTDAILDGIISNDPDEAKNYLIRIFFELTKLN